MNIWRNARYVECASVAGAVSLSFRIKGNQPFLMNARERRRQILEEAWIGDAVLCLYSRTHILANDGCIDGEKFGRMTSNQFLAAFGEPSAMEAEIGRVYRDEGLEAAFAWIEAKFMPNFKKLEAKRNPPSRK